MPLPDANDPKTSNLYAQMRSSQIGSASSESFDKAKDPVFFNAGFEDEARRLKLWGEISGMVSSSGPLAGTAQNIAKDNTDSSGSPTDTLFTPEEGTVWQLTAGEWATKNANAAVLQIKDASTGVAVRLDAITGVDNFMVGAASPIYIGYPLSLVVYYYNIPGGGTNTTRVSLIRVR